MEKVVRDGQVAVLVSLGYGAGWYSWHFEEALLFDPSIVQWVEQDEREKILAYMELRYPELYAGGVDGLSVKWIPEGARFRIEEYDGAETLRLETDEQWLVA